jgi:branched-chain amino acid transport system substrate-binding protein
MFPITNSTSSGVDSFLDASGQGIVVNASWRGGDMRRMWPVLVVCGCLMAASCAPGAEEGGGAGDAVKIGAVFPLTGASAATGQRTLEGVRLAAEIVNEDLPDLQLPLAEGEGLPNLDGARVEVVSADHEEDPEKGASETERLITSENVVAVTGAYFSSVTLTASERAERLGIPFVNGSSSSPQLTEARDLQFFFRTGPSDRTFAETFFDFLDDLNQEKEGNVRQVAILHENTAYGTDAASVTEEVAAQRGYDVAASIPHGNGVSDVTPEASKVRSLDPDALFQASYTPEAILFTETFDQLNYAPNLLAYGAGYSDAAFFEAVGGLGNYTISRAAWALDAVRDRPAAAEVARMFEDRYGHPMDENSARDFTAALTLFQAIDEAGSTEPDAIQGALEQLEVAADQTIMPWDGIRFDETGQNELARGVILQYIDGQYRLIWPFDTATAQVRWPLPPFDQR